MFNLRRRCAAIGMIHVQALPGTPKNSLPVDRIVEEACKDAEIYKRCKVDGVLVENMHDLPYVQEKHLGPEVTAVMSVICTAVRGILPPAISCGVQVLAGGNKQALAVALASGLDFIRAEGFIFSHVADEGLMNACAGELLRYRSNIGASHVKILADIKKKHCSHTVTSDVSLPETAKAAEFFLADGLIVTGTATGDPARPSDVDDVKAASNLPVLVGSGVTTENVQNYLSASGLIIGSHFKREGRWQNEVCQNRVVQFMDKFSNLV